MTSKQVPLAVRVSEETRDAIAGAARDELRSLAAQVELILREWAVAHGRLPEAGSPGPARGRRGRKAQAVAAEAAA